MKGIFQNILYGGDYNPNQWPKEIWGEDMRLFDLASINSATVNVFSWAKQQPVEDKYDFTELDAIIDLLSKKKKSIVLATSTAAMPAWMFKKYPEVARVDFEGRRHKFGGRHNACPNSLVYRKYAEQMAYKLAERYGSNEHVVCWHINNEYGGDCYCENCEKAFRVWLQARYKTIEALNKAWNMEFWGHVVYDWDEVVLPNALSECGSHDSTTFAGMSIDYRRFMSDSMLDNFKMERDAIRKVDINIPITTNLMGTYKYLDYFKWAREMDIVSWDNYPAYNTPWSWVAMCHDLMRGLKNKPFMLMEQTPSQQNWQPYNSLKRPGQMRAQSYQTLAHGANTIQFFQLRRSIGGCEKFHGAVIEHEGTENTRVFREVACLGKELEKFGSDFLDAHNSADVGIIFDWENYWALEYISGPSKSLKYCDQIHQYYRYFYDNNIPVDMIPIDADFSNYKLIVAPVLYMVKEGMAERLERFVENGGIFVTNFMSGIVNESDNVHPEGYPGPLRKLAGVWVEEIDALPPEQTNTARFTDNTEYKCDMLCDLMHLETAEALAVYSQDFYKGMPAVTSNKYGKGAVFYVGTQLIKDGLANVLGNAAQTAGIQPVPDEKTMLEVVRRKNKSEEFIFIMNFRDMLLPLPKQYIGETDLITGNQLSNGMVLNKFDVLIIKLR
jgi:beta-galactosidase